MKLTIVCTAFFTFFLLLFQPVSAQKSKPYRPQKTIKKKSSPPYLVPKATGPRWDRAICDATEKEITDLAIKYFSENYSDNLQTKNGFLFEIGMFESMLAALKLRVEPEDASAKYGIRIYPGVAPNNSLRLIFIGDTIVNIDGVTTYHSMLSGNFCILESDNKGFYTISDPIYKNAAEKDIIEFQNRYLSNFKDSSYRALVNTGREMIKNFFPGSPPRGKKFAVKLLPSFNGRELLLISKPAQINSNGSINLISGKCYFNHMNECPNACPDNSIN